MAVTKVNKISVGVTYPVARKSVRSSLIVLFASEQSGVVIVGDLIYDVGNWGTDWEPAYNTASWEAVEVTING